MSSPVWPSSLPALTYPNPNQGWGGSELDRVIKTQMETGQPKRRRRFTAVVKTITVTLTLTNVQYTTLKTFRAVDCAEVLPFTKVDPESGMTESYIFDGPFKDKDLGGGNTWQVQVTLERQP